MQIVGAGLSKTGTMSLRHALTILGYETLHNDMVRLNEIVSGSVTNKNFRVYDDIDAVVDLPSSWFFEELLEAYPDAKCILTLRDEDAWWRSVHAHFTKIFPLESRDVDPVRWDIRCLAYGSASPQENLYRKRYRDHNARVRSVVPPDRLLVMNIVDGEGWDSLCKFLGHKKPSRPFPHGNLRTNLTLNAKLLGLANRQ